MTLTLSCKFVNSDQLTHAYIFNCVSRRTIGSINMQIHSIIFSVKYQYLRLVDNTTH